jgi:Mn2+/Fe2+ NRAMP family transporter
VSVLVALTVGLVWWIVAWALGIKAFDAFLLTLALVVGAATARIAAPFVQQLLGRESAPSEELGTERAN